MPFDSMGRFGFWTQRVFAIKASDTPDDDLHGGASEPLAGELRVSDREHLWFDSIFPPPIREVRGPIAPGGLFLF